MGSIPFVHCTLARLRVFIRVVVISIAVTFGKYQFSYGNNFGRLLDYVLAFSSHLVTRMAKTYSTITACCQSNEGIS
jgi:hypothetical protein